jgi:histone H3/H4
VPEVTPRNPALDDIEDGPDPVAPRISLALGDLYDDDDDSFHEAPPRRSFLPDLPDDADTGTMHSVEFGRRALSEDPRMMFSTRVSERFADLNELGIDAGSELEIDGPFITRRPLLDPGELILEEDEGLDDTTTELRALTGGRDGLGVFGNDEELDEPTFRFTIPQRGQGTVQPGRTIDVDEEENVDIDPELDVDGADDATAGLELGGYESDEALAADPDLEAYREEVSAIDRSLHTQSPERPELSKGVRKQRKALNISRYGHEYPSLPLGTVKKLATGFARSQGSNAKLSKDTLATIMQATDWFFEQVSEDLASYAQHAGRKMIEESDVVTLMKRQRQITDNTTSFSLAQKLLPRELLQELRIPPAPKVKRTKRKRMEVIDEDEEAD